MLLLNAFLFFISCIALAKSGAFVVRTLTKLATSLRLKEFIVASILMAMSTTVPELFVGINSALRENSELALGTVIGSNIFNLTIVMGVAILVKQRKQQMVIRSNLIKRSTIYLVVIMALPILLMLDYNLSRLDAIILLVVFILYFINILNKNKHGIKNTILTTKNTDKSKNNLLHNQIHTQNNQIHNQNNNQKENAIRLFGLILKNILLFVFGITLLLLSADFVVEFATRILNELYLAPILVGLLIIAVGTSLPELTFAVRSILTKHENMVLGDLIGAGIFNSTLVLGVTALIWPITTDFTLFLTSAVFMIIIGFIFMTFINNKQGLTWREGISLILLYIFFVIVELGIGTFGNAPSLGMIG